MAGLLNILWINMINNILNKRKKYLKFDYI